MTSPCWPHPQISLCVELGVGVPERGRLGVLVDVALPPVRGDRAERAAAVEEWDRAIDLPRQLARGVRDAFDVGPAGVASLRELRLRVHEQRVRARREPEAEQHRAQRGDQRADGGAGQVARRARHVQRAARRARSVRARRRTRPRPAGRPAGAAPRAIETRLLGVAGVRHRRTRACARPTYAGVRICFSTLTGTGSSSLSVDATTSPAMPDPPMPSTTMLRIDSAFGSAAAGIAAAVSCAAASCSGSPATASRKFSESVMGTVRQPGGRPIKTWASRPRRPPSW